MLEIEWVPETSLESWLSENTQFPCQELKLVILFKSYGPFVQEKSIPFKYFLPSLSIQ